MKIVLNETQYKRILLEQKQNDIEEVLNDSKEFTKEVASEVKRQFNLDYTFAATWGAVIGGFQKPIRDYVLGLHPELTNAEISLIIFGIILTFFSSNKEKLNKVLQIIKDKKLVSFFDLALMKSYDLRNSFFSFLESLDITFSKVSNMIGYTFLIPLVPYILEAVTFNLSPEEIEMFVRGISGWGATTVSSKTVSQIVKALMKRFKSKV